MISRFAPLLALAPMVLAGACGDDPRSSDPALVEGALSAQQRTELEQILETARQAAREGQLEEAITAYSRVLELAPWDYPARLEMIALLLGNTRENDPARALQELKVGYPELPDDPLVLIYFARSAYRVRDQDVCREAAGNLVKLEQATGALRAEAHFLLGSLYEQDGAFEQALACFDEALEIAPNYAAALARKGMMQSELGDDTAALATLRRALELEPSMVSAMFNLARCFQQLGRDEEAERSRQIHYWLDRYQNNPSQTEAAYEDRFEALEHLETMYPDYRAGRIQLTRYRMIREMFKEACASARSLIQEKPVDGTQYRLFVESVRQAYGEQRARAEIDDLLRKVPGIPEAHRKQLQRLVDRGFTR